MNSEIGTYPEISDHLFYDKIVNKKEFWDNRIDSDDSAKKSKIIYCLEPQQRFLKNFMSTLTQYDRILLYHSVGVGKTLAAISIAENFKDTHSIHVLVKNSNLEANFKKELLYNKCSKWNVNNNAGDETISKREISKNFSFSTYTGLKVNKLKNVVLVIDEVHNIINNSLYFPIKKLIDNSTNIKVILLSATPIYDNITEIFEIANLLGADLPIRNDLIKLSYVRKKNLKNSRNPTELSMISALNVITELGEEVLKKAIKGKVSYLDSDSKFFPSKIFIGDYLSKSSSEFKVVRCEMNPFQYNVYKKITQSSNLVKSSSIDEVYSDTSNTLFSSNSNTSMIVYPDTTYGTVGYNNHIKETNFLKEKVLGKYSCKLLQLLKNLKAPGKSFIYSNFVTNNGTRLIARMLQANGYQRFHMNDSFNGERSSRFIILDNNISSVLRNKLLGIFNKKENADGHIIKIIIGSPVVSEGLTFKDILNVHILEPYWNISRLEQIIGRAVRFHSHSGLLAKGPSSKKESVKIYLYVATIKKLENAFPFIDILKYKLAIEKDKNIKNILSILKTNAIDCELYTYRNKVTCSNVSSKFGKDTTTYSIKKHNLVLYNFIISQIKELFNVGHVYTIEDITHFIKGLASDTNDSFGVYEEDIYYTLNNIIKNKFIIKNPLKKDCTIIQVGDYYLANPVGNPEHQDYFFKLFDKHVDFKLLEAPSKKVSDKKVLKNINYSELGDNIYGSYSDKFGIKDNKFRIIDVRKISKDTLKKKDNRKELSSKVCTFYNKNELTEMLDFLGIKVSDITKKNDYCKILEKILVKKGMII